MRLHLFARSHIDGLVARDNQRFGLRLQGHPVRVEAAEISGTAGPDAAAVMVVQRHDEPYLGPHGSLVALSELAGLDVHDNEADGLLVARTMLRTGRAYPAGRLRIERSSFARNAGVGMALLESDVHVEGVTLEAHVGAGVWISGARTVLNDVQVRGVAEGEVPRFGVRVEGSARWWSALDVVGFDAAGLAVGDAGARPVGLLNDQDYFGGAIELVGDAPTQVAVRGRALVRVGPETRALRLTNARPTVLDEAFERLEMAVEPGCRPRPELCNGRDESCDGQHDEGLPLGDGCPLECPDGERCHGRCVEGGVELACRDPELDGMIDDDCEPRPCAVAFPALGLLGQCADRPILGGEVGCDIDRECPDLVEPCTGVDDDCDGVVDRPGCPFARFVVPEGVLDAAVVEALLADRLPTVVTRYARHDFPALALAGEPANGRTPLSFEGVTAEACAPLDGLFGGAHVHALHPVLADDALSHVVLASDDDAPWTGYVDCGRGAHAAESERLRALGWVPTVVAPVAVGDALRFATLWRQAPGVAWAHTNEAAAGFDPEARADEGLRPAYVHAFVGTGGNRRLSVVWTADAPEEVLYEAVSTGADAFELREDYALLALSSWPGEDGPVMVALWGR